ncbi:hypothetical protein K402DRAFT_371761 [Aulographum hederae CBS 113979]|uniref:Cora-domain-containing protein n=1 Tax=Aulographum hederae CBS 113979 TaxID=1176131 RepID=A0A6G1H9U0_9PEZI|nr:hypothetical protein K402DRAFT_371761 [Aulographum hederae CBS 113979]
MGVPETPTHVDWRADLYWNKRRLTPAELVVHDIRIESWRPDLESAEVAPLLEINPILTTSLLPDLLDRDAFEENLHIENYTSHRQEQQQLRNLAREYGWMNSLRSKGVQHAVGDPKHFRKCRWIHIPSKFSEYLQGCLLSLSDWQSDPAAVISGLRELDHCIYQNERFSKHGRYFSPFFQPLSGPGGASACKDAPFLLSVPFLDWTVDKPPPLRFQVDPREGYQSSRSSSHLLRSVLQHFYRLEDTSDREHHQVFTKHKPWANDRSLDLKVRRWYGHHPSGLNVDELWILVIDERHIVTFSSNQSWKSRWPPLQLASRIAEVSFRGIRNNFFTMDEQQDYTSLTHAVACLSGAVGMLHRSFWTDMVLCLSDRYAGYLGHLQFRLHRSPSTKLVMDLLQVQEELNIVIQIMEQQIDIIEEIQTAWNPPGVDDDDRRTTRSRAKSHTSSISVRNLMPPLSLPQPFRATYRQMSTSRSPDPISQLLENLRREFADLKDLRDNSDRLVNRTIQLVNIRLEDHGKAILVFTIVTIVFLPLSFVSSFFGMNVSDIRNMEHTQSLFWMVSLTITAGVVGFAIFLAFHGGAIMEAFLNWKENRRRPKRERRGRLGPAGEPTGRVKSFEVLDMSRFG